jgi:hypothetical protein
VGNAGVSGSETTYFTVDRQPTNDARKVIQRRANVGALTDASQQVISWVSTERYRSRRMIRTDKTWTEHWDKAEKAINEAQFLHDADMFDGAYTLAMRSCLQTAIAVSLRLNADPDRPDYLVRLRICFRDGRLPEELGHSFDKILRAHSLDLMQAEERDAKDSTEAIKLAKSFQRVMQSASDLTASHFSRAVTRAAKARGINIPPRPFV